MAMNGFGVNGGDDVAAICDGPKQCGITIHLEGVANLTKHNIHYYRFSNSTIEIVRRPKAFRSWILASHALPTTNHE